ncbi:SDR family oxidoreductase [Sporosarcina sp. FSL W7-1349]|uniref:SDR family NAD(P)-dependent oxidoreductase n=1 Tax=Sporosarcina sp. FSL W7-1349 TaxID=2921561 RepID=UPI0030F763E5
MRLENKVALITGGGTGIGKTTALQFAKEGASVVVTDIEKESGLQTVEEIRQHGGTAIFVQHDVRNEQDWMQVAEEAIGHFGKIDILFNNAGIFFIKPIAETTLEEWNQMMSINVTGAFLGMKHIVPHMIRNKGGSVINASSNAGLFGVSGMAAYGASKGAVRIMTKDAAMEFAPFVRVNSIHPGYIRTQMIEYGARVANKQPEDQAVTVPLKRLGDPIEVANLVLYLASAESSYITGSEFVLDGGVSAGQSVWEKAEG